MLLNDFFHITSIVDNDSHVHATLQINQGHTIFEGHFPGQPVVPGVCMMQMIKEIVENVTAKKTNISKISEMKFLVIIDPSKNNIVDTELKYSLEENKINVVASIGKDAVIHFRFKGQFEIVP